MYMNNPQSLPSLDGQRVMITGGLGFIGSNLARRCVDLGASVTVYDCLDTQSGGNIHNISDIENEIEIVADDIRNFEAVCRCVRGQDIVFHCAGYTSHPQSMREPIANIDVNCKGTLHLLEACRRFNPDARFVHVGTSTQIGRMLHNPVDECHPEFPLDIYSCNKAVTEKYVLIYANAHALDATVVRFANVFGPRSHIRTSEFGFVNFFVGLGLQQKDITVFGDGRQLRTLTYVDDCVSSLILASRSESSRGEVFFAVADNQLAVGDIAKAIVQHVGGKLRQVDWPKDRAAIEVGDAVISNKKIKCLLGWSPRCDLASGLIATKEYFAPRLAHYL